MPFTSFCELPGDNHLTFVPAVVLVYHSSLEVELSFIDNVLLFNMVNNGFREYGDMMLLYDHVRRNGRATRELYDEHFSHCQIPSHALFSKVYQRTSDSGTLTMVLHSGAVPRVGEGIACDDEYPMSSA